MRGKVKISFLYDCTIRITPAYAGKRAFRALVRACTLGSPPPMRGKALSISFAFIEPGITPAYAGKSHRANKS